MAKYHINPTTGNASYCRATAGNCPFGREDEHYATTQEARAAYEAAQETPFVVRLTKASDEYSRRLPVILTSMIEQAPSPEVKTIYENALLRYSGEERQLMHRFGEIYRNKAENAYSEPVTPEARAYYTLFMLAEHLREYRTRMASMEESRIAQAYWHSHMDEEDRAPAEFYAAKVQELEERTETLKASFEAKLKLVEENKLIVSPYQLLTSDYRLEGFTIKAIDGSRGDLREVLEGVQEVYPGKSTEEAHHLALASIEENGQELVQALAAYSDLDELRSVGPSDDRMGPVIGAEEFELIAGGGEANVYLHRPTMLVYKVRHADGLDTVEDRKAAVVTVEQRYKQVDSVALEVISASYLKTYFIAPQDDFGEPVPLVVHPFLDPARYGSYEPSADETTYLMDLGFDDLHPGNLSVDNETGRVVLFDCIYGSPDEIYLEDK